MRDEFKEFERFFDGRKDGAVSHLCFYGDSGRVLFSIGGNANDLLVALLGVLGSEPTIMGAVKEAIKIIDNVDSGRNIIDTKLSGTIQ